MKSSNLIKYLIYSLTILLNVRAESAETFLWQIDNPDNNGRVYLLGSIHLADSTLYPLHPNIEHAFDSSSIFVLEVLIDQINPLDLMDKMTYKDETTLESKLPEDLYKQAAELFESFGIQKSIYNKFKPWFALITLQSASYMEAGFSQESGIDSYFLAKARDRKMEVMEIESVEMQINLLDKLGDNVGQYIKTALAENNTSGDLLREIIEIWEKGDDEALDEIMNRGSEADDYHEIMEELNYNRNIDMAKKINEYLNNDKTYFVVVGAAHVTGEKGIVRILENNEKYTIIRY